MFKVSIQTKHVKTRNWTSIGRVSLLMNKRGAPAFVLTSGSAWRQATDISWTGAYITLDELENWEYYGSCMYKGRCASPREHTFLRASTRHKPPKPPGHDNQPLSSLIRLFSCVPRFYNCAIWQQRERRRRVWRQSYSVWQYCSSVLHFLTVYCVAAYWVV
jgi:hypothetical protein